MANLLRFLNIFFKKHEAPIANSQDTTNRVGVALIVAGIHIETVIQPPVVSIGRRRLPTPNVVRVAIAIVRPGTPRRIVTTSNIKS